MLIVTVVAPIDMKTGAIEMRERFDTFPNSDVPQFRVLLHGFVEYVANAELVEHAGDKAEVVQDLSAV